ncbi:MAG: TonB family protein [Terriglobales bacterium]
MSYQALLFCPDERTARVVSQVLSELEFQVDPCNEPFAAVKKLMAQHFDAIVVDCDNEQNAALLFKSARNSGSNQASLAVAVVEGQAGVAKAFRLGANLVLTKPIHVEQSKGTLRVARGLLRKGQAAKTAGTTASAETVVPPPSSSAAGSKAQPSAPGFTAPSISAASLAAPFANHSIAPPPMASASAFELDAEPAPAPDTVDAALLEYMPDNTPANPEASPSSAADSGASKQYAWQPRSKPMAEPMASALRRAAEAAGKSEFEAPPASASPSSSGRAGAAAAPARAREISQPNPTVIEPKPAAATPAYSKPSSEPTAEPMAEAWGSNTAMHAAEGSSSAAASEPREQVSDSGGSKKVPLMILVLLGIAAAGYFGWTRMQSGHSQPAPQSIAPANSGAASLPPSPAAAASDSQPVADEITPQQSGAASNPSSSTSSSSTPSGATAVSAKPSAAVPAEVPGTKISVQPKASAAEPQGDASANNAPAVVKTEAAQSLVVKNGPAPEPKPEAASDEPVQAPAVTSIANSTSNPALTGLVNTTAVNATKAAEQTLRISQGVSQGLIIKKVTPVYPPQALQMRLEGKVDLQAKISKNGSIAGVKQSSGDVILGRAAIEAVRQWKYKPYFLNGEPVDVETQITVNFKLP